MQVKSLGYVHIETMNLEQWREYGTAILGMMEAPGMPDDGALYLKADERPFRFVITSGERERLLCCGWELEDKASFDAACENLAAAGHHFTAGTEDEAAQRRVRELVKLDDPSGNGLELYWGAQLDYAKFVSPVGLDGYVTGDNGNMGFGHAVLPAPRLGETHSFYQDILGFGDSDYMHFKFTDDPADPGLGLNFMHVDNPRHHSLALYEDANNPVGCVHLMLEVNSIDEVGYCLDRVNAAEIPVVSSLGRHTNDHMLSFYMATPSGFAMEFGTGGRQMDWDGYTPTVSTLPSFWGHKFDVG